LGLTGKKLTRRNRKLHNEKLYKVYFSPLGINRHRGENSTMYLREIGGNSVTGLIWLIIGRLS
jgi:hypothetical protein